MVALLPLAFGCVLIETVAALEFSATVGAKTRRGKQVQIPLRDLPLYETALAFARDSRTTPFAKRLLSDLLSGVSL